MWRIHFTSDDLARTHVAAVHPMWELVLSLHKLFGPEARDGPLVYSRWRELARTSLTSAGLQHSVRRLLGTVAPPGGYFPDFLTPVSGALGLEAGVDAVLSTPRSRLRTDLTRLSYRKGVPGWVRSLAAGDTGMLRVLGDALRRYFETALVPFWPSLQAAIDADRALRAGAYRKGGVEAVLASLRPGLRWEPPVLLRESPNDVDVHLDGRGLTLIPSYFCWRNPIKYFDPRLPPVLLYPIRRAVQVPPGDRALGRLLGGTRAHVLESVGDGRTTGELSTLLGVSAPSVSEHTGVLREAGLIVSHRYANTVVHSLTPLGLALLESAL